MEPSPKFDPVKKRGLRFKKTSLGALVTSVAAVTTFLVRLQGTRTAPSADNMRLMIILVIAILLTSVAATVLVSKHIKERGITAAELFEPVGLIALTLIFILMNILIVG